MLYFWNEDNFIMKKTIRLFLLFLVLFNCERDDICPENTPTTPHLIIRLYDISNQESNKNAFKMRIQGVGNSEVLENYNVITTDSIVLPLRTDASVTEFSLHKDYEYDDNGTPGDTSDDIISGNEDILTITYATQKEYVTRACGYKTTFENVIVTQEDDGDNWIQLIQSVNDNLTVENENAAHYKIFH